MLGFGFVMSAHVHRGVPIPHRGSDDGI
jgi:hypothetical protein